MFDDNGIKQDAKWVHLKQLYYFEYEIRVKLE